MPIESIFIRPVVSAAILRWVWIALATLALASYVSNDTHEGTQTSVTACLNASGSNPGAQLLNDSDTRIVITNDESELDALISCANA